MAPDPSPEGAPNPPVGVEQKTPPVHSVFPVLHSFNRAVLGNAPLALVVAFFLGGLMDSDMDRARVLFLIAWAIGTLAVCSAKWILRVRSGPLRWFARLCLSILFGALLYWVDARAVATKEADDVRLNFKPGDLSVSQRRAITHAIYTFRNYLKGTGFPVADHIPRLALAPTFLLNGRSISTPAMALGGEQMFIQLAPDSKDVPRDAMLRYAQWEVMNALIKNNQLSSQGDVWGSAVSSYFVDSYSDHFTAASFFALWESVLWSIRSEFGKEFADDLAADSVRAFQLSKEKPPETVNAISPINNPFDNNFIAARLRDGLIALDTGSLDRRHIEAINKAFKKAGLIVDQIKQ